PPPRPSPPEDGGRGGQRPRPRPGEKPGLLHRGHGGCLVTTTTIPLRIDDPAYFDRLADVEARHWWALGLWRLASYWLDAALAGRSGLRALDVGCGTGL